jgi:iron complex outermembrane receptor protein
VNKDEWGVYVQDDWSVLDALTLTLGYRYSDTEFTADIEDLTGEGEQAYGEAALKAGATYTYAPGSKLYASYSDGYRLPTTDELFAYDGTIVELDPERADTYEVGVRHSFGTLATLGLSLYEMQVSDELYFNPITYANENIDETRHRGAELSGDLNMTDAFTLGGAWSYTKATIESGEYEGQSIPLVPENKVSLSGAYTYKIARFAVGATWVDERFLDNDLDNQAEPLADYTTVDMKVTLTDKNAELFFGVDNVLDEEYEEYGVVGFTASEFYPAPGRRYYAGLKMTF